MEYFLRPDNAGIWADVKKLAAENNEDGIRAHVLEAQRLTSSQRNVRVATAATELEGKSIQPGNVVVMMLVSVHSLHPPNVMAGRRLCPYLTRKILTNGRARLDATRQTLNPQALLTSTALRATCLPSATVSMSASHARLPRPSSQVWSNSPLSSRISARPRDRWVSSRPSTWARRRPTLTTAGRTSRSTLVVSTSLTM